MGRGLGSEDEISPALRSARRHYYLLAEQFEARLDEDEQDALHAYSSLLSDLINARLRALPLDGQDAATADLHIALIDQALAKAPVLTEPLVVYRGFSSQELFVQGARWQEQGYLSTTLDRDYAGRFAERSEGGVQRVAEIELPVETRIAPLFELAEFPSEEELLLPRGSSFEIIACDDETLRLRLLLAE